MPVKDLSRRQFLKMLPILAMAPFVKPSSAGFSGQPATFQLEGQAEEAHPPNVIILLFDALSALHLNTYGYRRQTTTNLERLVQRASVYHNHHSAGNFTTPSTASFLSGVYPWTHRALNLGSQVLPEHTPDNLFNLLAPKYNLVAYTQNLYADTLIRQFGASLDRHIPLNSYTLAGSTFYDRLTQKDSYYALTSFDEFLFDKDETSGSLFLSAVSELINTLNLRRAEKVYGDQYPNGFPLMQETNLAFTLEQAVDGIIQSMGQWQSPFLAYLHFMPPHAPYRPRRDFRELFNDGWNPAAKPIHPLSRGIEQETLNYLRLVYDQFIANLDAELGKILDYLEKSGRFDDSYVIFTSDHGEMFERGMRGHSTRLMYEPVIRVPLFISKPGQKSRKDIYNHTSTVDMLPSLLHIAGQPVPSWCDGTVLPEIGGNVDYDQLVFSVEAKSNSVFKPLTKASIALLQGDFKLISYIGYSGMDRTYEFYNLKDDPDEMVNLYQKTSGALHPRAEEMRLALRNRLNVANQPFE